MRFTKIIVRAARSRAGIFQGSQPVLAAVSYYFVCAFGKSGTGDGQFTEPMGVAVDGSGNVWVADPFYERVEKFSGTGTYLTQVYGYGFPKDVAVDAAGNVYAASESSFILKYSSTGSLITTIGSFGVPMGSSINPTALRLMRREMFGWLILEIIGLKSSAAAGPTSLNSAPSARETANLNTLTGLPSIHRATCGWPMN